jgi:hypothetical protein
MRRSSFFLAASLFLTPALAFAGKGQCATDNDCADGQSCNVATGECITPECDGDVDCEKAHGSGWKCDEQQCVPPAHSDSSTDDDDDSTTDDDDSTKDDDDSTKDDDDDSTKDDDDDDSK